ncbi:MAG: lactate utilization protein [Planctomycetota bacterium]|nr:MAG: lactate utilization protein [Planctomycetota bacterium]
MDHPVAAARFVANSERAHWHDRALWFVRQKRDRQAHGLPEWEELRERASAIKAYALSRLGELLEQFERQATAAGATVHWAADAAEHNAIVLEILRRHYAKRVVKSKSMLTEECHLNPFLERHGVEVVDTDLGERIVQLRGEPPSHIVMPAIHLKREEVGELFHRTMGTPEGLTDAQQLAEAARQDLRRRFREADVGITGVNFAIAETGGIVVCTNEGNADLGVSFPPVHIACMGIEKIIPRLADLSIFLRLLARSATGQPITAYSSHFHGPRRGGELHIVLVDNGRTNLLASDEFRRSLQCIRCGACMNTCPVYRRSGGHSYGTTVPGPIGSILAPARDTHAFASLPYACSLCGSCTDVCPVKIDLHHELLLWRREVVRRGALPRSKRWPMRFAAWVLRDPRRFERIGRRLRSALRILPRWLIYNRFNPWGRQRELPPAPPHSFRELWRRRHAERPPAPAQGDRSGPSPRTEESNRPSAVESARDGT